MKRRTVEVDHGTQMWADMLLKKQRKEVSRNYFIIGFATCVVLAVITFLTYTALS
jgi:negative regulator of sigma E activity